MENVEIYCVSEVSTNLHIKSGSLQENFTFMPRILVFSTSTTPLASKLTVSSSARPKSGVNI